MSDGKAQPELPDYYLGDQHLCFLKPSSRPLDFVIAWGIYGLGWLLLILVATPMVLFWLKGTSSGDFYRVLGTQFQLTPYVIMWLIGAGLLARLTLLRFQEARRWYPEWRERLLGRFPVPDLMGAVVFNRRAGTVRYSAWDKSRIYSFAEITGRVEAHYKKQRVEYSVGLFLPGKPQPFASLNTLFDRRADANACWDFVQRYMMPDAPLPAPPHYRKWLITDPESGTGRGRAADC